MSILKLMADLLVREHLFRPIRGDVLTLGRQAIRMSKKEALAVFSDVGCKAVNTENDSCESNYFSLKKFPISDGYFFGLFGIDSLSAMDVHDREGANLVHDLNLPVPESLEGKFDFIVDGGTFDHLLDIRMAFQNVVRMLKPDGRVLHWNAASNYVTESYLCFSPDFFYDYYVANQFVDCKVYIAEALHKYGSKWRLWEFMGKMQKKSDFSSPNRVMTVVLAERGPDSTSDEMPIQLQYRGEASQKLKLSKRMLLEYKPGGPKIIGFNYVGKI